MPPPNTPEDGLSVFGVEFRPTTPPPSRSARSAPEARAGHPIITPSLFRPPGQRADARGRRPEERARPRRTEDPPAGGPAPPRVTIRVEIPERRVQMETDRGEVLDSLGTSAERRGERDGREAGERTQPPQLDWPSLEYVGDVSENLMCPICQSPLVFPVVTKCGHVFCANCFDEMLDHTLSCPLDRRPFKSELDRGRWPARPAPRIINNILDELRVKCPNRRCARVMPRSSAKHHYEDECLYTKVPCVDPGCPRLICRLDQAGTDYCQHDDAPCEHCGVTIDLANADDHYEDECTVLPTACEHCGASVLRNRYTTHIQQCPEVKMPCQHANLGCPVSACQADMGLHDRGCPFGAMAKVQSGLRHELDVLYKKNKQQDAIIKDLVILTYPLGSKVPGSQAPPPSEVSEEDSPELPVEPAHGATPEARPQSPLNRRNAASGRLQYSPAHIPYAQTVHPPQALSPHTALAQVPSPEEILSPRSPSPIPPGPQAREDDLEAQVYLLRSIHGLENRLNASQLHLAEQDARQSMMLINERLHVQEQLTELRGTVAAMGMDLRFVMARQKSLLRPGRGGGPAAAAGGSASPSATHGGAAGGGGSNAPMSVAGGGGSGAGTGGGDPNRSYFLGITPPRL